MGHNVGKAADRAVQKSEQKSKSERTPEQILIDIRRNLDAGLSVTPLDIRYLLDRYDDSSKAVAVLGPASAALLSRAEVAEARADNLAVKLAEFREVYDQENQKTVLRVDVMADQIINDSSN